MAPKNEAKRRLERAYNRVATLTANGDMAVADAKAISLFARDYETECKPHTVAAKIYLLCKLADRSDVPLTEATLDDIEAFLMSMKNGTHPDVDKSEGIGVAGEQAALRVFYRHYDGKIDFDDIDLDDQNSEELKPDDLLFQEEIDDLLEACNRANIRDTAFVAMALATGQRLDVLRTVRLKDIRVTDRTMEMRVNEDDAATKGAYGWKPLLWAKHYVRPWYESHPYKDDPEAYLFCVSTNRGANRLDEDDDLTDPVHGSTLRGMVRRRAKEAGLDKRVYPHLFRHCAITRLVGEGIGEQIIKNLVGWSEDSSNFATYVHLWDQLSNDALRKSLGLPTEGETPVVGRPSFNKCPECGDNLPEEAERCKTCGQALTHIEHIEGEHEPETGLKDRVDDMTEDEMLEVVNAIQEKLSN